MVSSVFLSGMLALQPLMPWIEYAVFKDYIAEHLCINRDKPDSCCEGKCFLEKRLKEVNHDEQQDKNLPGNTKTDITLYTLPLIVTEQVIRPHLKTEVLRETEDYSFHLVRRIFHPPEISG